MSSVQIATKLYQLLCLASQCATVYWVTTEMVAHFRRFYQSHQHESSNDLQDDLVQLVVRRRHRSGRNNRVNTVGDISEVDYDNDDDVRIVEEINIPNQAISRTNSTMVIRDVEEIVPDHTHSNLAESSHIFQQDVGHNDVDTHFTQSETATSLESPIIGDEAIRHIQIECFICARPLHSPGKEVAQLPFCMHSFHNNCLNSVLRFHSRCPICNNHLYTPL